uniref:Aminopeptidase n=1 Tax=Chrysomela tremula TaxID=63687 RepID=D9HP33_CHRTR|nr:membrane alanyl aminopeptidase 1 [Chrysomela tremula]
MKGTNMAVLPYTSIVILLGTATCILSQEPSEAVLNYRLRPIYRPHLYQINLTVPSSAFTPTDNAYSGIVNITFSVVDNSSSIIELHVDREYLQVQSVVFGNGEQNIDVSQNISFNDDTDIMTIGNQSIVVGKNYTLEITFGGLLSTTDMNGFYKSSYTDVNGTTKYLATTQFQPTSARRAFPCFDEPALKAKFDINIKLPTGMLALSNTLRNSSTIVTTELQEVQFERTPTMSTYLIAFVISDFDCTNAPTMVDNVPHQVCSRQEASSSRSWAEEIGPKVLASLNNYTQIGYGESMGKLDQIAIPDFSAGAMENWGLVTYREAYLLWDPEESSNRYKQYVATIISHELAHQWFGNLVTMQWWSETFLNEGFATFFEYFTTHDVLPEWELDKQYVIDVVQNALRFDVLESIQPLQSNVSTTKEVFAKFNTISYHKGGSIFRMIEHIMGAANFRSGLQAYLKSHRYNNTVPEDLWTELNKTTDLSYSNLPEPLDVVLDSWIKKTGFPLVKATLNGSTVTLTQSRFLLSGNTSSTSEWFIPITYTTSTDENKFASTSPREWLKPNSAVNITLSGNESWIILNNHMTGFYRVNYDSTLWDRIGKALRTENFGDIHEVNRAQIIDDLFNLARTNQVRYSEVFGLIEFLNEDASYFSWTPALNGFSFLLERVGRESDLGQKISSHLLSLMTNLYESTPIRHSNESDQIYTLKQVLAQSWACYLGHPNCTQQLRTLYSEYKINGSRPNKNLRDAVYCTALRHSNDSSDWEFLWNKYLNATLATEKSTILNSLGCSTNEILLEGYLNMTLNDTSGIRSQDRYTVFLSVLSRNTVGIDVAARFMMANYAEIIEKYQSMNSLTNMLMSLANKFTTQQEINMLKNFTESSNLKEEYVTVVNSAISTAEANLKWMQQFEDDLYTYYEISNSTTNPPPTSTNGGISANTGTNIVALLVVISLFSCYN